MAKAIKSVICSIYFKIVVRFTSKLSNLPHSLKFKFDRKRLKSMTITRSREYGLLELLLSTRIERKMPGSFSCSIFISSELMKKFSSKSLYAFLLRSNLPHSIKSIKCDQGEESLYGFF